MTMPTTIIEPPLAIEEVIECDLCRQRLKKGDGYHTLTLGLDELPRHVGLPFLSESTVEETSELWFCVSCYPKLDERVDALLDAIWQLRTPDPAPTETTPEGT